MEKGRRSSLPLGWTQAEKDQDTVRGARGKRRLGTAELLPLADTLPSVSVCEDSGEQFIEGAKLDRFIVVEHLGRGGMGDVVSAYDPKLDRKVAIKVLRLDVWGDSAHSGRQYLTREAQAMARLSHPNVVTVHEVGSFGDRLYIAMEYVRGGTVEAWLRAEQRSCSAILDTFIEAAQGLAAAHAAGLIHRDFKPRNVLVGDDGRARVTDFGLASISSSTESVTTLDGLESKPFPRVRLLDSTALTERGAIAGTPAYMSPEQFADGRVDARSDQFSFCVSLYEALYRTRPFAGNRIGELRDNVESGRVGDSPVAATVPQWLRAVVLRGLSSKPEERYASMQELISALRADPIAKRRKQVLVAGAGLSIACAAAALTLFLGGSTSSAAACSGARESLETVWNDEIQATIETAFLSTKKSYAEFSFKRVKKAIDQRAEAWIEMRTEACEAHKLRHDESAQLFDRRMRCLNRRLDETHAQVSLFAKEPDVRVLNSAIKAASTLPALEVCADREALNNHVPLPSDPQRRAEIAAAQRKVLTAEALTRAGRHQDALTLLEPALVVAGALDYAPLLASATYLRGKLEHELGRAAEAEKTLHQAARTAAEAKDDALVARAEALLVLVAGYGLHQHERALVLMKSAEVSATRAGSPRIDAQLARCSAVVLSEMGRFDEARTRFDKALAIRTAVQGADHPDTARVLHSIGGMLARQGKYEDARKSYERSLKVTENAFGPDHPNVAMTLANLAHALAETGNTTRAAQSYLRALGILKASFGETHPRVAWVLNDLGLLARDQGRLADARAYLERAVASLTALHGPDEPDLAFPLVNLGGVALVQDRYRAALDYCQQAARIRAANGPPTHPYNIYHLDCIGQAQLGRGAPNDAVAPLELAIEIMQATAASPTDLAATRYQLARALWDSKRDRKRAIKLVKLARTAFAGSPKRSAEGLAAADAWLAKHGR